MTLRPDELHLSKGGESIEDTAKIISSFGNAFMLRTESDKKLEEFKKYLSKSKKPFMAVFYKETRKKMNILLP